MVKYFDERLLLSFRDKRILQKCVPVGIDQKCPEVKIHLTDLYFDIDGSRMKIHTGAII
jgi:hypothetical protein